jgi:catechol 2,3-dioxygenase
MAADAGPRDPEELGASSVRAVNEIAPATTIGAVHLTVSDVDRSIQYYRSQVGLQVLEREGVRACLGVRDRELVVLVEEPGARPAPGSTGLYHFALLLPERLELARWLAHATHDRVALVGLADHFLSEALYLSDPDGHGIEIYWDRPREVWEGRVASRMTTVALDVRGLLDELEGQRAEPWGGLSAGTTMGHVHLKVSSVHDAVGFYRDVLGFALMAQLGSTAAFLAAGGYHHHIGANSWESAGGAALPSASAALRHVTIVLPDAHERGRLVRALEATGRPVTETEWGPAASDPSGNRLVLAV